MKQERLLEIIIETIKENIDIDDVDENSSFMDDLDMSSMEIFSFIGDLEGKLNIKIPERLLVRASTVKELLMEVLPLL